MNHRHHIIPKHAGGTDDPANLITLTVEEHATAHRLLYEQYGRNEDKVAWRSLEGSISRQEIISEVRAIGAKRGGQAISNKIKSYGATELAEYKDRMARMSSIGVNAYNQKYADNGGIWWKPGFQGKTHSDETKLKMSGPREKSAGKNGSQYGTCWITDGTINKKIKRTELESTIKDLEWYLGRTINNAPVR